MNIVARSLVVCAAILIGISFAQTIAAQSALDGFDPNTDTNGTVDPGFDPNANDNVYSFAVDTSGRVLVGGSFSGANSIGGQTRNHLARLDGVTGAADSFDPIANGIVYTIVLQADGKILVGGN